MLFDWLATGHVLDVNPAHAVRQVRREKGKTPVLSADEARELLESIKGRQKNEAEGRLRSRRTGTDRFARSRAHRRHGLDLRPHQCRPSDESA
jgi:hypothetical protein